MADTPVNRRMSDKDFQAAAEYIADLWRTRKANRSDREKQWAEVDRQIRMIPLPLVDEKGKALENSAWMSNLELPFQAQTLEVLTADARRLMFPDDYNWFSAHCATTDEYLERVDFQSIIAGDENDVPSRVTQEDTDALIEGVLAHYHSQYDLRGAFDSMNAEAFKYGSLVGRVKMVTRDTFTNEFRGVVRKREKIPVIIARSIKNTYLDDNPHAIMHEGLMIGPSFIEHYTQKLDDLKKAAKKGKSDPNKEDGGWMPARLNRMEPKSKIDPTIDILEYEGDLLIPRQSGAAMFLPGVIASVAVAPGGPRLFRLRFREFPFRSYLSQTYHQPDILSAYGDSPLLMGSPVQKAAAEAFNIMMNTAKLSAFPPVSWNPSDAQLMGAGGPLIEPGAQWPAESEPKTHEVGNLSDISAVYAALVRQYQEVTGVTTPRTGGQTKSHQTAFAVDSEISRGVTRTVDYTRSLMFGILPTFLSMEYEMAKKALTQPTLIYLPKYRSYVEISAKHLPDTATFEAHGAAGPLEERERKQAKNESLKTVMEIEPLAVQAGAQPMNYDEIRKQILHEGGWSDVDPFFTAGNQGAPNALSEGPGGPQADGLVPGQPGGEVVPLVPG